MNVPNMDIIRGIVTQSGVPLGKLTTATMANNGDIREAWILALVRVNLDQAVYDVEGGKILRDKTGNLLVAIRVNIKRGELRTICSRLGRAYRILSAVIFLDHSSGLRRINILFV
ncbi:hypothetical protein N7509_003112 [Penicillium cosmopolitanum]|uniref:Uncharacterized protein n=1 Tax=Penicillium cosmopolitanum TaxID=1131564 RepID=A0A9X0BB18_9EURO|nr:uncharacterized protein N7509_003112 [Penicillium cosmopolitanum]KAJ5403241.1 hypothetical protein N7509_003112 [Penicillium cosmopolitanum]